MSVQAPSSFIFRAWVTACSVPSEPPLPSQIHAFRNINKVMTEANIVPATPSTPPTPADPTRHFAVWPKRLPRSMSAPDTTLWANLDITMRRFPDRIAFVFINRSITYRELHARVESLAGWLQQKAGVSKGDRVALCMQNSLQFVIGYYAILRADAVVVPVNPMNKAAELSHYITDPCAKVAICGSEIAAEWAAANSDVASKDASLALQHLLVTRYCDEMTDGKLPEADVPTAWRAWLDFEATLPDYATRWTDALAANLGATPPTAQADDMAVLPYTSGTTGLPKGCIHTHRTIGHNVVSGAVWGSATMETVSLAVVPMFHITGMLYGLHLPIYVGCTSVIMPRWDRDLAGTLISRHQATSWTMIPTMMIDLFGSPNVAKYDLTSLVYIGGGGAAMPAATIWLALRGRLRSHRNRRAIAFKPTRRTEAAVPWHSLHEHRRARG
jgi:fatty-acyl-CoA synthase